MLLKERDREGRDTELLSSDGEDLFETTVRSEHCSTTFRDSDEAISTFSLLAAVAMLAVIQCSFLCIR